MKAHCIRLAVMVTILIARLVGASTNVASWVTVDSRDMGDTNSLMRIVEVERGTNTSKLRFTSEGRASSVGWSMFIMLGFYEVAKARGAEWFINLKEWEDGKGGWIYIAGFAHTNRVDLRKEFGSEYSETNAYGQARRFMSVGELRELRGLFEGKKRRIESGRRGDFSPRLPHHRTCGSAYGGSWQSLRMEQHSFSATMIAAQRSACRLQRSGTRPPMVVSACQVQPFPSCEAVRSLRFRLVTLGTMASADSCSHLIAIAGGQSCRCRRPPTHPPACATENAGLLRAHLRKRVAE
jgi:hypothetical protein